MAFLILLSAAALGTASAEYPSYAYSLEDAIPQDVQFEIISLLSSRDGLIGSSAGKGSLITALEIYLNCFGVYPPVNSEPEVVPWLQETLVLLGRVTEIPQRYTTNQDIRDWLDRYAEPGDLLLYRVNGQPDKCLLYAGNGKYIGKRQEKYALLDIPSTFVASDGRRTSSSVIYGVGRIWSSPAEDPSILEFVVSDNAPFFTGLQFVLLVSDPGTGFFTPSSDYVLFEYSPGVFRLWDGTDSGVSPVELSGNHFCLSLSGQDSGEMTWRLMLSQEDAANDDEKTIRIPVSLQPVRNLHRWYGRDLLRSLAPDRQ